MRQFLLFSPLEYFAHNTGCIYRLCLMACKRTRPRRHHVSPDTFSRAVRIAKAHGIRKIGRVSDIRSGRHLLEPLFVQPLVSSYTERLLAHSGGIKRLVVIPVALQDAFGHISAVFILVMPRIIAPHPRAAPCLLDNLYEPKKIMPPHCPLTKHDITAVPLRNKRFFVIAKMEKSGIVKNLHHIPDYIFAHT